MISLAPHPRAAAAPPAGWRSSTPLRLDLEAKIAEQPRSGEWIRRPDAAVLAAVLKILR